MSRRTDAIETLAQVGSGIVIGFFINLFVLPMLGVPMSTTTATVTTTIYFVVSSLRSYALRRLFRWVEGRPVHRCKYCGHKSHSKTARSKHEDHCGGYCY